MFHCAIFRMDKICKLIFIFRNINTIRAIAKDHGDPIDRFTLMARSATQGAFVEENAGIIDKLRGFGQRVSFEIHLLTEYFKLLTFRTFYKILVYFERVPNLSKIDQDVFPQTYME